MFLEMSFEKKKIYLIVSLVFESILRKERVRIRERERVKER
jgi:hypothetical protein